MLQKLKQCKGWVVWDRCKAKVSLDNSRANDLMYDEVTFKEVLLMVTDALILQSLSEYLTVFFLISKLKKLNTPVFNCIGIYHHSKSS